MVTLETVRKLALSFPEVMEEAHFEKTSFRIKKKIFATCNVKNNTACIKLSASDQDVFSFSSNRTIYAVPNKWGQQGWTIIEMKNVTKKVLEAALSAAYCEVAPKKLSQQIRPAGNEV